MSLWTELKRRNVVKVGMAYVVVGWIMLEVASVMAPALNLPSWTASLVAFLLILGFPVALVFAWAYELTPDGLKRTADVAASDSMAHATGQKLNYIVAALLVAAVGLLLAERFGSDTALETTATNGSDAASVSGGAAREVLPNSIAVLPFANLSPDPDNDHFAAGIHDTILNELANIEDITVIARSSMLRYADGLTPIPQIAEELNVETVMEGSIQVAEGQVSVTAQLIDPQTEAHLWSNIYNRELEGIFEIQADIARQIAVALEAELTQDELASIERPDSNNADAWVAFARALEIWDSNGIDTAVGLPDLRAAILSHLNEAIRLDPEFARAYAWRAYINAATLHSETATTEEADERRVTLEARALSDLDTATQIDPNLAEAHWVLARIHQYNWRGAAAEAEFERAIERSSDPRVLAEYSWFESLRGRHQHAVELASRAVELAPLTGIYHMQLALALSMGDDVAAAIDANRRALELEPDLLLVLSQQADLEYANGNYDAAFDYARRLEPMLQANTNLVLKALVVYWYGLLDEIDEAERLFREIEAESADRRIVSTAWILLYLGIKDFDNALEWMERAAADPPLYEGHYGLGGLSQNGWHDPVLDRPEFVEARSRLGFRPQEAAGAPDARR